MSRLAEALQQLDADLNEGIFDRLKHPRGRGGQFRTVADVVKAAHGGMLDPAWMEPHDLKLASKAEKQGLIGRHFDTGAETEFFHATEKGTKAHGLPPVDPKSRAYFEQRKTTGPTTVVRGLGTMRRA